MKRIFKSYFIVALAAILSACAVEDGFEVNSAKLVDFDVAEGTPVQLFVLEEAGFQGKIPVNLAAKSNSDVNVSIQVIDEVLGSSGDLAISGLHYDNLPTTFTIPAGTVSDTLTFDALFSGFATPDEIVELSFRISGAEGANVFSNDTVSVMMQKYTPLDINDFVGTFDVVSSSFYGGGYAYTVTTSLNTAGTGIIISTLASAEAAGIGRTVTEDIEVIFVDVPGNAQAGFSAVPLNAPTTACGASESIFVVDLGDGTFNAAAVTFNLDYGLQVSCGFFEAVTASFTKQ